MMAKTVEQLEHDFWQLRIENERDKAVFQKEMREGEQRFNAKLFYVVAGAISLITILGVIIGLVKSL